MASRVHAVVLNWNRFEETISAVQSLLAGTYTVDRVIVVDNGSSNDSVARIGAAFEREPRVQLVENGANLGFSAGVNAGIAQALQDDADSVLLLNDDAVLAGDCLARLVDALEADATIGIAAPRIFYHADPERVWQGGGTFSRLRAGPVTPDKNRLRSALSQEERDVSFVTGCVMLIRREVFQRVGLFSLHYYFYGEDVDFCLRARRGGFRLRYLPAARAWHKIENVAKDRTSAFVLYHLARGRIVCARRNFSRSYAAYAAVTQLLVLTPFRLLQIARGSRSAAAARAWFRGTWAGIRDPAGTGGGTEDSPNSPPRPSERHAVDA